MSLLLTVIILGKILAIAAGAYFFGRLTPPYRIHLFIIAIALFCEVYGYYLSHYLKRYNAWVFNFYILAESWAMVIAGCYLVSSRPVKRLFVSLLIVNSGFWLYTVIRHSILVFANTPMSTGSMLISALYIYILVSNGTFSNTNLVAQPVFWLAVSVIVYFTCVIPFMAMHGYLHKHAPAVASVVQDINGFLNIIRYPLTGVSFIMLGTSAKYKTR